VNTFTNFGSWNVLSFSFIEQELVKDGLETVNHSDFFEISLQFVHSHCGDRDNFMTLEGFANLILVILHIIHSVKTSEKFTQFFAGKVVAEDEDLIVGPDLIESFHELMRIFT
jgi:hypothetical protein